MACRTPKLGVLQGVRGLMSKKKGPFSKFKSLSKGSVCTPKIGPPHSQKKWTLCRFATIYGFFNAVNDRESHHSHVLPTPSLPNFCSQKLQQKPLESKPRTHLCQTSDLSLGDRRLWLRCGGLAALQGCRGMQQVRRLLRKMQHRCASYAITSTIQVHIARTTV